MKFLQILTLVLVILIPLYPLQLDTRIIFAIAGFALFLYRPFIKNFTSNLQRRNPVTIWFILFLLASTISTIFSIDREQSLFTLLTYFSVFIIFTSIGNIFPTQKSRILLISCYLLSVTILSIISLYNTLVLHYTNRSPEGLSFMWNYFGHNHLSALLILAIPISIALAKLTKHSTFYTLFSTLSLFTLLFTFGLGSIISLLITGTIFFLTFRKSSLQKKLLTIGAAVILSAFILVGLINTNRDFGLTKKPQSSFRDRTLLWRDSIKNGITKPFTGWGLDTFRFIDRKQDIKNYIPGKSYSLSFPLQALNDMGIFGFISSIGLVLSLHLKWLTRIKLLKGTTKSKEKLFYIAIWVSLVASTINTFTDFDWQIPYVFFIFWLLAGLL